MDEKQGKKFGFFRFIDLPYPPYKLFWENIVIDPLIKNQLWRHIRYSPQLDTDTRRDCAVYGVAILYGEPGNGKTMLVRGCANEVAERLLEKTGKMTKLMLVNFGTLFSELLGQSIKAVSESFEGVKLIARHNRVIVNLEEIEVLTVERSSLGSSDPSEVMRCVATVLTEIDELRFCKNVTIIGTSNLEKSIDRAFWDRSDLKIYIGRPDADSAIELLKRSFSRFRKLGIKTEPELIEKFVNRFYNGEGCYPFSGRELCRIPYRTFIRTGLKKMTVQDVLCTGESMLSENRKESSNGKYKEKNMHRPPKKRRVGRKTKRGAVRDSRRPRHSAK